MVGGRRRPNSWNSRARLIPGNRPLRARRGEEEEGRWLRHRPRLLVSSREMTHKHHIPRDRDGRRFGAGLCPFHSPLLRASRLFSFPPLIKMLKFDGENPRQISGRENLGRISFREAKCSGLTCKSPARSRIDRGPIPRISAAVCHRK